MASKVTGVPFITVIPIVPFAVLGEDNGERVAAEGGVDCVATGDTLNGTGFFDNNMGVSILKRGIVRTTPNGRQQHAKHHN